MIKGKITQNGLTLDLECSSPIEFVSVLKGTFNSQKTEKVVGESRYKVHKSGRISKTAWSDNDVVGIARVILENKDNLFNISRKAREYLSTNGDNRNRSLGSINFKVNEIRHSLFSWGKSNRAENLSVKRALSENGMLSNRLSNHRFSGMIAKEA